MKHSIIIPTYGYSSGLLSRLWEIHAKAISHAGSYEVIIVDDAYEGNDTVSEKALWCKENLFDDEDREYEGMKIIRNRVNYGFGMSCNIGFEHARGDIVYFLSTDVEVKKDFLQKTSAKLSEPDTKKLIGGKLLSNNTGWNTFDGKVFPYLEGWFIACKASSFIELGGWDISYGKFDYEDIDLSTKAIQKGYVLEDMPDYFNHFSGMSISKAVGSKRIDHTNINREVFRRKWANIK